MHTHASRLAAAVGLLLAAPIAMAAPVHDWSRGFAVHSVPHVAAVATDGLGNVAVVGEFEGTIDLGGAPLSSRGVADIFVAKLDPEGDLIWSRRFGSFDWDTGSSIRLDAAGNVVLAGRFRQEVDFGGGPLGNAGNEDIFVAKYDGNGNHVWSRSFGDRDSEIGCWIDLDDAGNVVLLTSSTGVLDFGGGPLQSAGNFDIFVAKLDADGEHLWSHRFGDVSMQMASSVAVDSSGNVVLTSRFTGSVDFGGGQLTSAGNYDDIGIACLDADGQHLWSRRFGDTATQRPLAVATDASGNVALAGYYYGTVEFGGDTFTSVDEADAFLAKFDASGNHLWSHSFEGELDQVISAIAVNASDEIVVSGFFERTVDFGGGELTTIGPHSLFVASFDAAGEHLWSEPFENVQYTFGTSIAAEGTDDVVFAGGFRTSVDLGGGPLVAGLNSDAFVAKLDAGGEHLWSRRLARDSAYGGGVAVALDGAGSVTATGYFQGTADLGGGPVTSVGDHPYLMRFDSQGNYLWSRIFGDGGDFPTAVVNDALGNVLVTGSFTGSIDFGGGPLSSVGGGNIFLAKLDGDGNHLWSRRFGDGQLEKPGSLAVDGSGNVLLAGFFSGAMDFGDGPLMSAGGRDAFVAKFDPDGNPLWSRRFGDASEQSATAADVDDSGNVFLAGSFGGTMDFGGGPHTATGFSNIFVASLDADGNHRWSHHYGGGGHYASSIATDGPGNVVLTGSFQGTVDFGGGPFTSAGTFQYSDIYLASFDTDGNHRWSRHFGSNSIEYATSVDTDDSGNVVLTGSIYDDVDFGGGPLSGDGYADIYLASFDTGGNHRWSRRFVGEYENYAWSVATGGAGVIALTGELYGTVDFGGGNFGANSGGAIFIAQFRDAAVPVRFARFEATAQPGFVELQWDVFSEDAQERFTLYRQEDGRSQRVAIAEGLLRGAEPSYVDAGVEPGKAYRYQLAIHPRVGDVILSEIATVSVPTLRAHLAQNSPNPFNPRTTIAYTLGARSAAVLAIYDAAGKLVARLDQGVRPAGMHHAEWDGRDDSGQAVASGAYFYRLEGVKGVGSKKMLLIR